MSLAERVTELLKPGGQVAANWPAYESRREQQALAAEMAETMEHGGVLLAEAPTGLGKSLAYLVPAILLAAEGKRVVIATCTRSLQDQLYEKDIPAVLQALDIELQSARLKGKQNYVCPRSLDMVEGRGAEENDVLDVLRIWATSDPEGDLDRFPADDPEAFARLRGRVASDPVACTLATCKRGRECHWVRARREATQAPLVVVNHALLALSGEIEGLLPDFDLLIVDEAHRLEGVLLSQLERTVSRNRIEEALRLVGTGRSGRGGGLVGRLGAFALPLFGEGDKREIARAELDRMVRRVGECREDVERLFTHVAPRGQPHALYGARERYRTTTELLGEDLDVLEAVLEHCSYFTSNLHRMADNLESLGRSTAVTELSSELEQVSGRFASIGLDLDRLGDASDPEWVYWRTAGGRGVELHGAPVTAGDHARRLVLGRARAAVLTSATLSTGGDFSFMAERLGLGEEWGLPYTFGSHPSPFALEQQMRTFVHGGGNDEASGVADLIVELAQAGDRNMLVLFTAHERLRRAHKLIMERMPAGRVVLAQERDGPASRVAERFRVARGAVLLGVQSLWEGVDFPGETLEIVVVAKLPFSVPDDPLVEARGERLRDRGLDPFRNDAVPEAVLRFRQGVGRLIRRADDRGVLIVCDRRLVNASYRRPFLESLAQPPAVLADARALASEVERFLAQEVAVEDKA